MQSVAGPLNQDEDHGARRGASGSLRERTKRSSYFEVGSYGIQQILRLASNLVLTRLLFPSAFGLTSMVTIVLIGLVMLSDMGIQQFIIQNPRGDEQGYLDTAFTVQAVRGLVLTVIMAILAYPAALFFKEPQLFPLIIVGSIQLLASGLRSTSVSTLRRKLTIGWITALDLGNSILMYAIMIPWVWLRPSVMPLVAATTISTCIHAAATHFLPVGYRNKFRVDREAYRELRLFGRWIFGSSAMTFLGAQGGRILYGRFLGMTWLGIYSVALNLSDAAFSLFTRMISGVVFPLLSQAKRDDESTIATVYYRVRLKLDALAMTGTGFLAGAGGWLIKNLWDERYWDAAWILRVLCIKVALLIMTGFGETFLTSLGHTRYGFWNSTWRVVATIGTMPIGWALGGIPGVIWASAIAELPAFFVTWPGLRRHGMLLIRRELLSVVFFGIAFTIGAALLPLLPIIHVRR